MGWGGGGGGDGGSGGANGVATKQHDSCNMNCQRGGSNEYPQSMFFLAEIRKIMYIPKTPVLLYKNGV